jgi:hypothetical protein
MWKADPAGGTALKEAIFSETSHLKRATLGPLEREKKIDVQRPKGARVIPGQYPPGTSIRFIRRQRV